MAAPASAAPIAASGISSGVTGRCGDIDGVWIAPVTAQVMMTFGGFMSVRPLLRGDGSTGGGSSAVPAERLLVHEERRAAPVATLAPVLSRPALRRCAPGLQDHLEVRPVPDLRRRAVLAQAAVEAGVARAVIVDAA